MCTVLLPPGVNPIAVNKYISYHILFVCKCVMYYCHRVATQLQLTNIYHIITGELTKTGVSCFIVRSTKCSCVCKMYLYIFDDMLLRFAFTGNTPRYFSSSLWYTEVFRKGRRDRR